MKGNDLDNAIVPRDLLVWEGLLGLLPDAKIAAQEAKFRRKGKWREAVSCYEINEMLARKVWDMSWRYGRDIELLTYLGVEFAEALEERIDREHMPFRRIWAEEPNVLARRLATILDVQTIYDPFPEHQFLYGSKGRIIQPHNAHHLFGSL